MKKYNNVMGLQPLEMLSSFSAGTVIRRENLTSIAVRF